MIFTPMRGAESVVILAGNTGGFDVRKCPNSAELAAFIRLACNSHHELRSLLEEAARRVREDAAGDHGLADRIDAALLSLAARGAA
jgi:hypothetical protein